MRSSPGSSRSSPPLKKKVTCAYFSVSAMRSCLRPRAATISPITFRSSTGLKIAVMKRLSCSEYSTMPSAAAKLDDRGCARKPSKAGSSSASRISRARSARKLAMTMPSPSFMPAKAPITVGRTNSSVTFLRIGLLDRGQRVGGALAARVDQRCVGERDAVPALVAVHGVVAAADGGDRDAAERLPCRR